MKNKMAQLSWWYHVCILSVVFAFLLFPLLATLLYSFSTSWGVSIFPDGLTLKWYVNLFLDSRFWSAFGRSLWICFGALVLSIAVIFPVVFVSNYYFLALKKWCNYLMIMPFIVPSIVTCVGLLNLYSEYLGGSAWFLIFSYFLVAMPFIYRALQNDIENLKIDELLHSHALLGGHVLSGIVRLVIPNLKNGMMVAFFLSFAFLMGEFLYANFLVGSNYETLQLYLYQVQRKSGHYSSAVVIFYFFILFVCTFIAVLLGKKE